MAESREPALRVTSIEASPEDPNQRLVREGRRVLARLHASDVEALGLRVGRAWTPAVAQRAAKRIAVAAARQDALRLLGRLAMSSARLRERLLHLGHGEEVAAEAVRQAAEDGWLDDEAFARQTAQELLRRGTLSRAGLAAVLLRRGTPEELVERVVEESFAGDEELRRCEAAARSLLREAGSRSSKGGAPAARRVRRARSDGDRSAARRAAMALIRRGFDADTISAALRRLGVAAPDDE